MNEVQRTLEEHIDTIFSDYSVHPAGVILVERGDRRLRISPKHIQAGSDRYLWGYSVVFIDRFGNESVKGFAVENLDKMIDKIREWAWSV